MIVVDTNVITYLFLRGEKTAKARAAYLKEPVWAAPILWRSELRSVLATYLRRGQADLADALELVREAESLLEGEEYQVESDQVLGLVSSSGCSACDCEFVALAKELGVSLITGDRRLVEAFPDTAVALESFASDPSGPDCPETSIWPRKGGSSQIHDFPHISGTTDLPIFLPDRAGRSIPAP